MPGQTIGLSFAAGYAGTVSRSYDALIEAYAVNASSAVIPFGSPVILNSDASVSAPATVTPTAANFLGIAVNEVKQNGVQGGAAVASYSASQMADVIKRGDVMAICKYSTGIAAGGAVYVRTATNVAFPSEAVGDLRSAADGANTVQLTNCCWKNGRLDANNMTELTLKWANN